MKEYAEDKFCKVLYNEFKDDDDYDDDEYDDEDEEFICSQCGHTYWEETEFDNICQDCINESDQRQDERDNSSCYSHTY